MSINRNDLRAYADVVVKIGLNLQPGQRLYVGGPNIEAAPLIREIVSSAYSVGSSYVDVVYTDEQVNRIRYEKASPETFSVYPRWPSSAVVEYAEQRGAVLWTIGGDPDLLAGQNPEYVAVADAAQSSAMLPATSLIRKNALNWCGVSVPVRAWAEKVYPELTETQGEEELWRAILHICRIDAVDPIAAWNRHVAELEARAAYLNVRKYRTLEYRGPSTDLRIQLADGHRWLGGRVFNTHGIPFTPNLPTEEVFTAPRFNGTEGVVTSTRPFSRGGVMIDRVQFSFSGGRVVNLTAKRGEDYLRKLIRSDEGAARLGEVALVPNSSPISQTGRLFYNPLIDENAASHIALGAAYRFSITGADEITDEEFAACGGNISSTHMDFMIGSGQLDVDGVTADGKREVVMRSGEWAFSV